MFLTGRQGWLWEGAREVQARLARMQVRVDTAVSAPSHRWN